MDLSVVERASVLDSLAAGVDAAVTGRGNLIFLAGEAGIGKSTVVGVLVQRYRATLRTLVGAYDAMATPHPLGSLRDMARTSPDVGCLFDDRPRRDRS